MLNLVQKLIYSILALQDKVLRKRFKRILKTSFNHSTSKSVYTSAASLNLTSKTEKNKERLQEEVKLILKKFANNPEKLLEFVERKGTGVYKIPAAKKILTLLGIEEGLIGEQKGLNALYLTTVLAVLKTGVKVSLKTKPMFVLGKQNVNQYYMIQQFHKWYAMKLNLPGFDTDSQNNFQKFLAKTTDDDIKSLSMDEIIGLKEAIARDVEAINFVVQLAKATEGSKEAVAKIKAGGASI